ncbi:MAG: hypothetical protein IKO74_00645 [Selenomonadaceae bacterium]|nr:hypothetical protein [Selenomonadaceae bacterium]
MARVLPFTALILNIECVFLDGDMRTITLKNPRSNISSSNIENLETFMQENNIIIGDRDSSDFRKIKRAVKRNTTTKYPDLE